MLVKGLIEFLMVVYFPLYLVQQIFHSHLGIWYRFGYDSDDSFPEDTTPPKLKLLLDNSLRLFELAGVDQFKEIFSFLDSFCYAKIWFFGCFKFSIFIDLHEIFGRCLLPREHYHVFHFFLFGSVFLNLFFDDFWYQFLGFFLKVLIIFLSISFYVLIQHYWRTQLLNQLFM